eukprot:177961-Prymnesium_polylepis.1
MEFVSNRLRNNAPGHVHRSGVRIVHDHGRAARESDVCAGGVQAVDGLVGAAAGQAQPRRQVSHRRLPDQRSPHRLLPERPAVTPPRLRDGGRATQPRVGRRR